MQPAAVPFPQSKEQDKEADVRATLHTSLVGLQQPHTEHNECESRVGCHQIDEWERRLNATRIAPPQQQASGARNLFAISGLFAQHQPPPQSASSMGEGSSSLQLLQPQQHIPMDVSGSGIHDEVNYESTHSEIDEQLVRSPATASSNFSFRLSEQQHQIPIGQPANHGGGTHGGARSIKRNQSGATAAAKRQHVADLEQPTSVIDASGLVRSRQAELQFSSPPPADLSSLLNSKGCPQYIGIVIFFYL